MKKIIKSMVLLAGVIVCTSARASAYNYIELFQDPDGSLELFSGISSNVVASATHPGTGFGDATFTAGTVKAQSFIGNGSSLTGVSAQHVAPVLVQTNLTSGTTYVNASTSLQCVSGTVSLSPAAVAGTASMALRVTGQGGSTNSASVSTQLLLNLSTATTQGLSAWVYPGGTFTFTNTSTGTGNTATIVSGSVTIAQF